MSKENDDHLREVFSKMAPEMKNIAAAMKDGKMTGKGTPASGIEMKPTKFCVVCHALFSDRFSAQEVKTALCGDCNRRLEGGFTAVTCQEGKVYRYAFCKFPTAPESSGKIIPCSPPQMDAIQKRYKDEWKVDPEEGHPKQEQQ